MTADRLLRSKADPTVAIDPKEVGHVVEEVFPEALGVWVYGSFADGWARKDSDIDIAILPDRPIDGWELLERSVDVRLGREIDLVDLSAVSDLLQYEATARGVRVAARDPVRCDMFETAAMSKWLDQRRMLRDWMRDIHERGTVY
jgi:predicted nucleotidyltransferase